MIPAKPKAFTGSVYLTVHRGLLSETNLSLLLSEYDIAKSVGIIAIHVLENNFGKKDRASIPV
jgi:hypothetical protein